MAKKKISTSTDAKPRKTPRVKARTAAASRYQTLTVDTRNQTALIGLARPDVHNAFNQTLIAELTSALRAAEADDEVRAVVLLAHGNSFCAGADLNWMKQMAGYDLARNIEDATAMALMLKTLNELSKPTIARVHGAAYGGGVGLVACCDIAIAAQDATFSFSEAKLGLIPATISPYIVAAIGARQARRYFVSAERFTAAEAFRIGLIHDLVAWDELDTKINELLGTLLMAGPKAQAAAKTLIRSVANRAIDDVMVAETARRIAAVRASAEGREGVAAFLDKRAPAWVPDVLRQE